MSPAEVASLTFCARAAPLAHSAMAATAAVRRRETNDCIEELRSLNEEAIHALSGALSTPAARPIAAAPPRLGRDRGQLAHQRELARQGRARRLETKRAPVRLRREQGVHVAEVLVRGRIAGIEPDRFLELGARLAVVAGGGVDRGQVVVRLGELGVVLHELLQNRLRFGRSARVGEHHRLEKPHLRVLGLGRQDAIGTLERGGALAGAMQAGDLAQFFGGGSARRHRDGRAKQQPERQPGSEDPELHRGRQLSSGTAHVDLMLGRAAILNRL